MSELASELADGLFLQTSQVRIVGANAVESNQDLTDVSADFVPLSSKFDDTTSHLLASRLWSDQVPFNKAFFGSVSVLSVIYPGTNLLYILHSNVFKQSNSHGGLCIDF